LSSFTQFLSGSLELEQQPQRGLVLYRTLLGRKPQILIDEAQVDPGELGLLGGVHRNEL
jgi:hypothetical protein